MRDLDQNEFVEALRRQEKNFKNCSFDLSQDGTRVRKRGLKIIEKPAQKKQTAAAVEPKVQVKQTDEEKSDSFFEPAEAK